MGGESLSFVVSLALLTCGSCFVTTRPNFVILYAVGGVGGVGGAGGVGGVAVGGVAKQLPT
jgi:hypothetical protein